MAGLCRMRKAPPGPETVFRSESIEWLVSMVERSSLHARGALTVRYASGVMASRSALSSSMKRAARAPGGLRLGRISIVSMGRRG
jgi:hypothetical protein